MTDHQGRYIDIVVGDDAGVVVTPPVGRRWLGIQFDCCNVYTRVYKNADGTAYEGRCPHCARPVRLRVGSGGTDSRFFTAR